MDQFTRIIIALVIALIVMSIAATWYYKTTQSLQTYTIGLVWIPTSAYHQTVGHDLMRALHNDKRFVFKEFSVPSANDVIALNAICETALDSKADLLVSIGFNCTRALSQLSKKRQAPQPIIFTGLNETVTLSIVDSLENPGSNITGIYEAGLYEYGHPISVFLTIKPTVKSILMPYIVTADSNEPYIYQAQKIAERFGVKVSPLPIDKIENTMSFIAQAITHHDAIMYLAADRLSIYGSSIGKLASQHGITLFACTPDAKETAAFTYYVELTHVVQATADLIKKILITHASPANTAVIKIVNKQELTINVNRCREQGITNINPEAIITKIQSNPDLEVVHNRIKINNT